VVEDVDLQQQLQHQLQLQLQQVQGVVEDVHPQRQHQQRQRQPQRLQHPVHVVGHELEQQQRLVVVHVQELQQRLVLVEEQLQSQLEDVFLKALVKALAFLRQQLRHPNFTIALHQPIGIVLHG
jgi:hypothetical protein